MRLNPGSYDSAEQNRDNTYFNDFCGAIEEVKISPNTLSPKLTRPATHCASTLSSEYNKIRLHV
jgi:hypothetical protein